MTCPSPRSLPTVTGVLALTLALALSAAPSMAVVGGSTGFVAIVDLVTGLRTEMRSAEMENVLFSPDGNLVAMSGGPAAWLWDWREQKPPQLIPDVQPGSSGLAFSPNGLLLAVAGRPSEPPVLVDVASRKVQQRFVGTVGQSYYFDQMAFLAQLGLLPEPALA